MHCGVTQGGMRRRGRARARQARVRLVALDMGCIMQNML